MDLSDGLRIPLIGCSVLETQSLPKLHPSLYSRCLTLICFGCEVDRWILRQRLCLVAGPVWFLCEVQNSSPILSDVRVGLFTTPQANSR